VTLLAAPRGRVVELAELADSTLAPQLVQDGKRAPRPLATAKDVGDPRD